MPECDYCGATHESETAHLEHLETEHYDELGPIDKRRVGGDGDDGGFPTGPVAIGVVLLAATGIVGYVVFVAGGSSGGIGQAGSAHYHGGIEVTITGDTVDFSQPQYQNPQENRRFHFEGGDGSEWHAHATGVTLEYGMSTLGIGVGENSITFDGTEYVDGEGYEVIIQVNGESVSPDYVLTDGDDIRIVVREA